RRSFDPLPHARGRGGAPVGVILGGADARPRLRAPQPHPHHRLVARHRAARDRRLDVGRDDGAADGGWITPVGILPTEPRPWAAPGCTNYWYTAGTQGGSNMARNTSVSLGDHFTKFIAEQVESGRYGSASEVIREG